MLMVWLAEFNRANELGSQFENSNKNMKLEKVDWCHF